MSEAYNHENLVFLTDQLASTLVAVLSGTRDRTDIHKWVNKETVPTAEQVIRINFASSLFQHAVAVKGSDVGLRITRAWFLGGNVGTVLDTPMTGIRENRFDEVTTSHERMLNEDYFGVYCDESATLAEKYCGVFII